MVNFRMLSAYGLVLFSGQSFVQLQHAVVVGGVGKEAQEIA